MKIYLKISLLFFVISNFYSCSNSKNNSIKYTEKSEVKDKKSEGRIEFSKELHSFGSLKAGEIVAYSFLFKNIGKTPISIVKCDKSCGCIEAKFADAAINPHESSSIEVIFNTAGEWGNQLKTITVTTSTGESINLTIGAYIENENFNNIINN